MSRYQAAKLFVGNLKPEIDKESLRHTFAEYGEVESVWVAKNPPGFAFIEFRSYDEARKAIEELNGKQNSEFTEETGPGMRVEISTGAGRRADAPREDSRERGFRQFAPRRRSESRRRSRRRDRRDDGRGDGRRDDKGYDEYRGSSRGGGGGRGYDSRRPRRVRGSRF
ncbi:unnamed protein product [Amoebophrya sp. A25]|nr:unnamed protein product [Amoebophrya sp. A25]|eukprot:GSA25T00013890001.1